MTKSESYSGIDYFRFIAALLIVAIHTSPLSSFSETGNFIIVQLQQSPELLSALTSLISNQGCK